MSGKMEREMRALYYHSECGGYYPAMERSARTLYHVLRPTPKKLRRLDVMMSRKIEKYLTQERRYVRQKNEGV